MTKKCFSVAVWADGHYEHCTRDLGHQGAHERVNGGPGSWWLVDVYAVDFMPPFESYEAWQHAVLDFVEKAESKTP